MMLEDAVCRMWCPCDMVEVLHVMIQQAEVVSSADRPHGFTAHFGSGIVEGSCMFRLDVEAPEVNT